MKRASGRLIKDIKSITILRKAYLAMTVHIYTGYLLWYLQTRIIHEGGTPPYIHKGAVNLLKR
jgi:hypothetical protein